jgi:hypothetical protein
MIEDMGTTKRGGLSTRRKLKIWERESGKCAICSAKLMAGQFIYEHMRALELGWTDTDENIRLTCLTCAKEKTKKDHQITAKAKSQKSSYLGLKTVKAPLPCGKKSKWKKKLNGQVVLRGE